MTREEMKARPRCGAAMTTSAHGELCVRPAGHSGHHHSKRYLESKKRRWLRMREKRRPRNVAPSAQLQDQGRCGLWMWKCQDYCGRIQAHPGKCISSKTYKARKQAKWYVCVDCGKQMRANPSTGRCFNCLHPPAARCGKYMPLSESSCCRRIGHTGECTSMLSQDERKERTRVRRSRPEYLEKKQLHLEKSRKYDKERDKRRVRTLDGRTVFRAKTPELAAQINAHIRTRLAQFKAKQRREREEFRAATA